MRPSVFPRWFPSLLNDLQTEKKKLPDFSGSLLLQQIGGFSASVRVGDQFLNITLEVNVGQNRLRTPQHTGVER